MSASKVNPVTAIATSQYDFVRATLCVAVITSLAILGPGCAYYGGVGLDQYESPPGITQQRLVDGLYVAVHDLSPGRASERFFDREIVDYGFVPVMLSLDLHDSSIALFDVNRHDLRLVLGNAERLEAVAPETLAQDVAFSYWRSTFGFLFILPGFFVASSVTNANEDLLHDYKHKSFNTIQLGPRWRSFRGVVFFSIHEELRDTFAMEDAFVEVKIYKRQSEQDIGKIIEIPVHFHR